MKSTYIIAFSVLTLALFGCAKTEPAVSIKDSDKEISFTSYTGRTVTKSDPSAYNSDMMVSSYVHSDQTKYFENKKFSYSSERGEYVTTPVVYWPLDPADGTTSIPLDFYAVSSTSGQYSITTTTSSTANDTKTIVVTSSNRCSGNDDIVAGKLENKTKESTDMVINFGHKLTKISFKVLGADPQVKYEISTVIMTALSTGTYNFSTDSWSDPADRYAWYYLPMDEVITLPYGNTGYIPLTSPGKGIMLIPEQEGEDELVEVRFFYNAFKKDVFGNDVLLGGSYAKSIDLTESAKADWGVNKSIVYKVILPVGSDPITFNGEVNDWTDDQSVVANYCPDGALPGVFSVSANKKVYFSSGNLQATRNPNGPVVANGDGNSRWVFCFAENQYDIVGSANVSGSNLGNTIDLFGWSSAGSGTHSFGISKSTNGSDYGGNTVGFNDWGTAIHDNVSWFTLSGEEWHYLLLRQGMINDVSTPLRGNANVMGVNGLIFLPDDWDGSVCDEFHYGNVEYSTNTFNDSTATTWQDMESAGAVFLPVSGRREGTDYASESYITYWSSTPHGTTSSSIMWSESLSYTSTYYTIFPQCREDGLPVRLVTVAYEYQ